MRKLMLALTMGAFVGVAVAPQTADAGKGSFMKRIKAFGKRVKARFNKWQPRTKLGKKIKAGIKRFAGKAKTWLRGKFGKVKAWAKRGIKKIHGKLRSVGQRIMGKLGKYKAKTSLGKRIQAGLMKLGKKGLKHLDKGKNFLLNKVNKAKLPLPR